MLGFFRYQSMYSVNALHNALLVLVTSIIEMRWLQRSEIQVVYISLMQLSKRSSGVLDIEPSRHCITVVDGNGYARRMRKDPLDIGKG